MRKCEKYILLFFIERLKLNSQLVLTMKIYNGKTNIQNHLNSKLVGVLFQKRE